VPPRSPAFPWCSLFFNNGGLGSHSFTSSAFPPPGGQPPFFLLSQTYVFAGWDGFRIPRSRQKEVTFFFPTRRFFLSAHSVSRDASDRLGDPRPPLGFYVASAFFSSLGLCHPTGFLPCRVTRPAAVRKSFPQPFARGRSPSTDDKALPEFFGRRAPAGTSKVAYVTGVCRPDVRHPPFALSLGRASHSSVFPHLRDEIFVEVSAALFLMSGVIAELSARQFILPFLRTFLRGGGFCFLRGRREGLSSLDSSPFVPMRGLPLSDPFLRGYFPCDSRKVPRHHDPPRHARFPSASLSLTLFLR